MSAALLDDYSGPFDPAVGLGSFSRRALAHLGREYLLHGHLQDRAGLPLVVLRHGIDVQGRIAIEEWMAASPIYSKRTQRALGFEGDDVGTVFKNLQLDIGAPPQFMDFRFRLDRPDYGEFWLDHCGALMDVEPFGSERVKQMCHDIEDPTFDATAAATNPRMVMRPIHRPPRDPGDRHPHCRWKVYLDEASQPYTQHANLEIVRRSKIASLAIDLPASDAEPGGWPDYAGPFDPDFQLEDLSHRALRIVIQEAAVQSHLLARAFLLTCAQHFGEEAAAELGVGQFTGIGALSAARLRRALGIEGDGAEAIAKIFQLHPCFQPRTYADWRVELDGDEVRIALGECAALAEGDAYSWFAGLGRAPHPALDAIAWAVNPRARCIALDDAGDARLAWRVGIDADAPPRDPPRELKLARLSRGADFAFEPRRPLRMD